MATLSPGSRWRVVGANLFGYRPSTGQETARERAEVLC